MNSLPKTVTRQRRGCDANPGPSAPESSTLIAKFHYTGPTGPDQTKSADFVGDPGLRPGSREKVRAGGPVGPVSP